MDYTVADRSRDSGRFGRAPEAGHWPCASCCMRLGAQVAEEMLRRVGQQRHSEKEAGSVPLGEFRFVRGVVVVLGEALGEGLGEAGQQRR